jgi:pyruvate/2-oxoglutarate dehydrogenase complex dihydrolipoamide dehydrogenase (E3) component
MTKTYDECVNTGCTPTKTMVTSAYAAHMDRRAADFGAVENWLRGMTNCTVYHSHGRLEPSKEVSVGSEGLTADRIFINVGGRAAVRQIPGIEGVPYRTRNFRIPHSFVAAPTAKVSADTIVYLILHAASGLMASNANVRHGASEFTA